MGFTWVWVYRSFSTFLSDSDERVFLCPLEDVKDELHGCVAMRMRR